MAREEPNLPLLTPEELTVNLTNRNSVEYRDLNDQLWADIQAERARGQLVLVMGAGTVDGWLRSHTDGQI